MNKIIIPIIVIVISFSLIAVFTTLDSDTKDTVAELNNDEVENKITPDAVISNNSTAEPEPEPVSMPQTGLGFSVNVSGDMHDKSFFTISGTIPDNPNHLTGTIRTGEGDDLRIVYVFQIELEDGVNQYQEKIGINTDYLWEEDTFYTVSVNHGNIFKEVEFYRGTTMNDFRDSIVPII